MVRLLFCFVILLSFAAVLQGQKSEGGEPYSRKLVSLKKGSTSLPSIKLKQLDIERLLEDEKLIKNIPAPFGIYTDTLINLKAASKSDVIESIGQIWRLEIENITAKYLQLFFKRFVLPKGAKLFIYNKDQSIIAGAFTKFNMNPDSSFTLASFKGNCLIIEYFEPAYAEFSGELIIGAIGQAYKDPLTSQAESGFLNINCPIGAESQLAKHAVCKMEFRTGIYQATCSGSLLNNVRQDGTPYFLTANHCISTQTEATSLVVYFNYEVNGCSGDTVQPSTLTGSQLLSTGQPSDYTLLKLNSIPESRHQAYYAGWDINDSSTNKVTGIHHPAGQTKKISIDHDSIYSNPVIVSWDDNSNSPINSHWVLGYDEGETSQGSSGSPLFNSEFQVIGQLHGGDTREAYYGKLAYSYSHKPSRFPLISEFLDPDSTGVTSMPGYIPEDNNPDAFFTTSFQQVCWNSPVTFTDYSVFGPYDISWSVSPSTFEFVNGTSDTSKNPVIQFNDNDIYIVTQNLTVAGVIKSTEELEILAGVELALEVKTNAEATICDCDFKNIKLFATGAENYTWIINDDTMDKMSLSSYTGDSTTAIRNPDFIANSGYSIHFTLVGSQATCSDTMDFTYDIVKPENDEIANAILLEYGKSDTYSNICATVEEGEPVPPFTSCTTQNSWCDEYGTGEDIVENSVWFKFVAGTTNRVSISSSPMDNELALYEADSYTDILNGNYVLLAANDDRVSTDPRPLIISELVTTGETYWIQVDGSGGGTEDEFYITINAVTATDNHSIGSEKIVVYPVPSSGKVTLSHPDWKAVECQLSVYSTSGTCILINKEIVNGSQFTLDVSGWDAGIYIARISVNNTIYTARIVKK